MSWRRTVTALFLTLPILACSTAPVADPYLLRSPEPTGDPDVALERCMSLFKADRFEQCALRCEQLAQDHPAHAKTETIRLLAAESRYHLGDFEMAYRQYRILLDAFPFTRAHSIIPSRLHVIGKGLLEKPAGLLDGLLHDRTIGIDALGYLVIHYAAAAEADDAWFVLGAAHFESGEYDLACEAYRRLTVRYPDSDRHEEAMMRIASCQQSKARGAAYDREPLVSAWHAAKAYLLAYRNGRYVRSARQLMRFVEGEVRQGERLLAEFYRKRGQQQRALLHERNAAALDAEQLLMPRTARPSWHLVPHGG